MKKNDVEREKRDACAPPANGTPPFMTNEQLAKLPKYAQDAFRWLAADRDKWRERATASAPKTSNVSVERGMESVNLPQDARVRFKLGIRSTDYVEVHHGCTTWPGPKGEVITVRAGHTGVTILPEACNAFSVRLAR